MHDLNWEDERFVKLYTRDTGEVAMMSWEARGLFWELWRKVDMAGCIKLNKRRPARALAALLRCPQDVAQRVLDEWLGDDEDAMVELSEGVLRVPCFVPSQAATQSVAARKRKQREREKLEQEIREDIAQESASSRTVTESHAVSRPVTSSDGKSRGVTERHEKSLLEQSRLEQTKIDVGFERARPPVATPVPKQRPDNITHHPTPPPTDPAFQMPERLREPAGGEPTKRRSKARPIPDPTATPSKLSNGATGPSQAKQGGNGAHGPLASVRGGVDAGVLDRCHLMLATLVMGIPKFARVFRDGQTLGEFCQDMMAGHDGMGGKPLPEHVVAAAVHSTARKLKPDNTDEQALRNVLDAQLTFKSRDWKAGKLDKPKGPDPNRFRPPPQ